MVNYKNSSIYKLCCKDTDIKDIYVGSTTNFKRRKTQHKSSCNKQGNIAYNNYVYQFIRENGGFNNWDMVEICKYSCDNKRELHTEERRHLELLGAKLNKVIPSRTKKEYYENNKQEIAVYQKEYRKNNKQEIAEQNKQYRKNNKEIINKKKRVKTDCKCGGKYTHDNKSRHFKSKKHLEYINNKID